MKFAIPILLATIPALSFSIDHSSGTHSIRKQIEQTILSLRHSLENGRVTNLEILYDSIGYSCKSRIRSITVCHNEAGILSDIHDVTNPYSGKKLVRIIISGTDKCDGQSDMVNRAAAGMLAHPDYLTHSIHGHSVSNDLTSSFQSHGKGKGVFYTLFLQSTIKESEAANDCLLTAILQTY